MKRLSVPASFAFSVLAYLCAVAFAVIALTRDFHFASFVSGIAISIAVQDALTYIRSTKGHTS